MVPRSRSSLEVLSGGSTVGSIADQVGVSSLEVLSGGSTV
jgi:hypothetical protein